MHNTQFNNLSIPNFVHPIDKPQAENFTCISQNWENLTCSWDPRDNNVDTVYSVTFKLPGRSGGRKVYPCSSDARPSEPGKDKSRNRCFWDSTTNPIYRQPYEYYAFHLTGENVLGNWSYTYKFHHFAYGKCIFVEALDVHSLPLPTTCQAGSSTYLN
jgi:hypothetical protein